MHVRRSYGSSVTGPWHGAATGRARTCIKQLFWARNNLAARPAEIAEVLFKR